MLPLLPPPVPPPHAKGLLGGASGEAEAEASCSCGRAGDDGDPDCFACSASCCGGCCGGGVGSRWRLPGLLVVPGRLVASRRSTELTSTLGIGFVLGSAAGRGCRVGV